MNFYDENIIPLLNELGIKKTEATNEEYLHLIEHEIGMNSENSYIYENGYLFYPLPPISDSEVGTKAQVKTYVNEIVEHLARILSNYGINYNDLSYLPMRLEDMMAVIIISNDKMENIAKYHIGRVKTNNLPIYMLKTSEVGIENSKLIFEFDVRIHNNFDFFNDNDIKIDKDNGIISVLTSQDGAINVNYLSQYLASRFHFDFEAFSRKGVQTFTGTNVLLNSELSILDRDRVLQISYEGKNIKLLLA